MIVPRVAAWRMATLERFSTSDAPPQSKVGSSGSERGAGEAGSALREVLMR